MQRWLVVSGVVVALTAFGLLVYGYERYYRGPKQSALFGTWECTSGCYHHIYFRLNPDHNVQALADDGKTVVFRGRWYAGGDFLYLRFIGEDIPQKHPITIWRIDDLSSVEMRIHSGDIIHTMTRVRPPPPSASNQSMKRIATDEKIISP